MAVRSKVGRNVELLGVLLGAVSFLALSGGVARAQDAAPSSSERQIEFSIRPQPLVDALRAYSEATGIQAVYATSIGSGVSSPGAQGRMSAGEALSRLLAGTGLTYRFTGSQSVTLEPAPTVQSGAIQLGPVRVEGSGSQGGQALSAPFGSAVTTEETRSYTTNAVTIGKTVLNPRDIPQSVSVVTRQRIEDQNLLTLDDALLQTPGITLTNVGERRASYSARGFGVDVVQIDGLPSGLSNNVLLGPDLVIYDRVEVIRGSNGLLQGTGDPSASINLVRKRPTDQLNITGSLSAGSWNNFRAEADVGGPIDASGRLRARVAGSFQDNDYFYDIGHRRRWVLYGVADYKLTDTTTLTAGYAYVKSDSTPNVVGMPRYSNGADLHLPRSTYLGAAWNRWRVNNQDAFVELRQEIGEWIGQAVFRRATGENNWLTASVTGAVNPATGAGPRISASYLPYDNKQTGGDIFFTGPLNLFGRTHTLLVGVTAREETLTFSSGNTAPAIAGPVNIFTFDPNAVPAVSPNGTFQFLNFKSQTKQAGVYGTARISLTDDLTAIIGGRVSWWEANSSYGSPATLVLPPTKTTKNGIFTPYAGVVYKLTPAISLYASYADIFKPQTGLQYPGDVLPPVVGTNYEAGIKAGLFGDLLNATLAVFQIEQTNRAVNDPAYPCLAGAPVCYMIPAGKVRSRGFEAELSGNITPTLQISAGYTYTETKYLKDTDANGNPTTNQGQPFNPYTPKHLFKLWADWTLPGAYERVSLGGGVQAQSEVYVQSGAVRITQGSYALVNARISYKINGNLSASVNVNNIFDKTYYSGLGSLSSNNYYGEPRGFMITLRGRY